MKAEMLAPPFTDVRIAPAEPLDVDRVHAILEEAARWLLDRGIRQWPAEIARERVAEQVSERACCLAWHGDQAVGTLSLHESDPAMWGEQRPDALYLHSLAVRRDHRGLGRHLLAWAEEAAVRAGKAWLRLDCMAENPSLRAYYERAGFQHVRDVHGRGWTASLYEKRVC